MTTEQTERLIDALERLSTGRTFGTGAVATGLEAVTLALGGLGAPGDNSVAAGLNNIAEAIRELAEAVVAGVER